jgi:hypothetical protein
MVYGLEELRAQRVETESLNWFSAKLGNRSDKAMKRCDEALNASLLQYLCQH